MATTQAPILTTDEILKKKDQLKQSVEETENISAINGNQTDQIQTMESGEKVKLDDALQINTEEEIIQNGHSASKDDRSSPTPGSTSDVDSKLSTDESIKLKRKHIEEVAKKLAKEEARYTVFKKIRLSQLSTENAAKEQVMDKIQENKKESNTNSSLSKSESNNKFKPIQPAKADVISGKNTPVLSPTPKNSRDSPSFTASNSRYKNKKLNSRDLDDVRQLAHFLAQNPKMSEKDIKAAKHLVFRKQLNKSMATCDPPQPEKPDIIFFPSNNSVDFINLVGLEQVVSHIKAMNSKKKSDSPEKPSQMTQLANAECWKIQPKSEPGCPIQCENCGTDFSPQWHKDSTEEKYYCISCVGTHLKELQKVNYARSIKQNFAVAMKHEKEMKDELDKEYEKQLAQAKEDQRRRELANKQIRELQKQKLQTQQLAQQQQALKQQRELQKVMELKKQERERKQQQMRQQANTSDSANTNAILRQLINQLTNSQNQHSKADIQRVMATVQSHLVQSGMNKQQEIMQILQQHILNQQQADSARKQQQMEAERKRQAELQRQRELEAKRKREQQEAERRRLQQREADQKKREQTVAIQQLLLLIQQTNNPEDQQKLLQVLLQQAGNNREVQARLVEQVVKMAQNQQKKK